MVKKRDIAVEELIIDLKAALSIGDIESIAIGLENTLDIPLIASNEKLSESAIDNIILPIGKVLAHPNTPQHLLTALTEDRLTGIRAISAVAQTYRYLQENSSAKEALHKSVRDHREEVGIAITQTLQIEPVNFSKIEELVKEWLQVEKEREWVVALNISHLIQDQNLLQDLYDQTFQADLPHANKALVLAIRRKKLTEPELIQHIITRWSNIQNANKWVMEQLTKE